MQPDTHIGNAHAVRSVLGCHGEKLPRCFETRPSSMRLTGIAAGNPTVRVHQNVNFQNMSPLLTHTLGSAAWCFGTPSPPPRKPTTGHSTDGSLRRDHNSASIADPSAHCRYSLGRRWRPPHISTAQPHPGFWL